MKDVLGAAATYARALAIIEQYIRLKLATAVIDRFKVDRESYIHLKSGLDILLHSINHRMGNYILYRMLSSLAIWAWLSYLEICWRASSPNRILNSADDASKFM